MLSSKHVKRSPNNFHFEAVKTTCQSFNSFSKKLTFPRKALFETNDSIVRILSTFALKTCKIQGAAKVMFRICTIGEKKNKKIDFSYGGSGIFWTFKKMEVRKIYSKNQRE